MFGHLVMMCKVYSNNMGRQLEGHCETRKSVWRSKFRRKVVLVESPAGIAEREREIVFGYSFGDRLR